MTGKLIEFDVEPSPRIPPPRELCPRCTDPVVEYSESARRKKIRLLMLVKV